jgi:hypothetical protein
MRSEVEATLKLKRRKKRKREKVSKGGQEVVTGDLAEGGGGTEGEAVAAIDELAQFQVADRASVPLKVTLECR